VLRQLFEEHPVSNSVKGQEERDHLYGRIFGIGAILRRFVQTPFTRAAILSPL
jgi:hypothetical protein